MRLRYQLFIILLLSSVAPIALLAWFNSWSFNQGFTNYIVDNEKQRLIPVAEQIAQLYSEQKNWAWLESQPQKIRELLRRSNNNQPATPVRPPGPGRDNRRRQRLILVDSHKQLLVGNELPSNNVVWLPVELEGDTIAHIGIREPRELPGELENAFVSQQLQSYGYAAVAMVVLTALMAMVLSSRIVKPILSVNAAIGQLTGGHYKSRIENNHKDELGILARNINQLALTLDQNQSARQQWMAEISHELRTPVAVLQGELEAIQDGISSVDSNAINSLHSETLRLSRLINDLHDLSMSDVGSMNYKLETVDIKQILDQRLQAGKTQLAQASLSVSISTYDANITIQADPHRLAQLFDNLLQNSVRYTDAGGVVDIALSATDKSVILNWSDSSPGVRDNQLSELFSVFYRTEESRNRELGGTGLGLAIVKKITIAHQGDVEAYHADSGGLGVKVTLPR